MTESVSLANDLISTRLNVITGALENPATVSFGTVSRIVGMTIEAKGLMVSLGTICLIQTH